MGTQPKQQMKLFRFIKKIVDVQELTTLMWTAIITCLVALIFWGIGWVAHYFGMRPMSNNEWNDSPAMSCGFIIFVSCLSIFLLIALVRLIINKIKWLRDQWRDA